VTAEWIARLDHEYGRGSVSAFSCRLFLWLLGFIYLVAFVSLGVQLLGLIGHNGILPAEHLLDQASRQLGPERYWRLPTVYWLHPTDGCLQAIWMAGAAASVLIMLDLAPALAFIVARLCYVSLTTVCREFLWFQWDSLLLEAGFLAIFLAPLRIRRGPSAPPSTIVVWLLRWLVFRVMFSSGVVKLASGDPTWRHLTALTYHYQTQPLPTWTSWHAHHAPLWFHQASCMGIFVLELALPLFVFGPRICRRIACAGFVVSQLLILATGNYGFFNLLTIALCLVLLDDAVWPANRRDTATPVRAACWPNWLIAPLAAGIMALTLVPMSGLFRGRLGRPSLLTKAYGWVEPFRIVSSYGLFAVMTTTRLEIIVEGSDDGVAWRAYEFRYKPGDLHRRPPFVAPHMPRLDWQMWFAALGSYRDNPWFLSFCERLLHGSPDVLRLLAANPFPDHPPRYVRGVVYEYAFTDAAAKRADGAWWRRELKGLYCPALTLR